MKLKKAIVKLMKQNGFTLIRTNKHDIWKHNYSNCPNVVTPSTPSGSYGPLLKIIQKQIDKNLSLVT